MTQTASMPETPKIGTQSPPPGRPSWGGRDDLPLIYLGWGPRNFATDPLPVHYDLGTNYFVFLRGEIVVVAGDSSKVIRAPAALLVDPDCAFGITQTKMSPVEILVWVWRGRPELPELCPQPGGFVVIPLNQGPLESLMNLHVQCRHEVSLADACLPRTLVALRSLMEVEILRASHVTPPTGDVRWMLIQAWLAKNLAIRATIPALCDYLRMSPSTLNRYFIEQTGISPGVYFRQLKLNEARRLIDREGWQVKETAYHLGYKHPNDLSRALRSSSINDADTG